MTETSWARHATVTNAQSLVLKVGLQGWVATHPCISITSDSSQVTLHKTPATYMLQDEVIINFPFICSYEIEVKLLACY